MMYLMYLIFVMLSINKNKFFCEFLFWNFIYFKRIFVARATVRPINLQQHFDIIELVSDTIKFLL